MGNGKENCMRIEKEYFIGISISKNVTHNDILKQYR